MRALQTGLGSLYIITGIRQSIRIMGLLNIFSRGRHERAGFSLYGAAVTAARAPVYFQSLGVPDTLDGRFDLIGLFAALVIRRARALPSPGPALAQAVFDAMFADMDFNLRELGVGDLSIPRRMRAMWEAFHGRALAYEAPLQAHDEAALSAALARNVWRGNPPPGAADILAAATLRQDRHLATQDLARLQAGEVEFLPAPQLPGVPVPAVQAGAGGAA
jgi:cytochrome b pre-mRNA-processing protein 3